MSESQEFRLKSWHVVVSTYPPAYYAAASRGMALSDAWRDYRICHNCTFGEFLRLARAYRVEPSEGFGAPIKVGGLPAYRVTGLPQVNNYVRFVRPGSDAILFSHPADVEAVAE